MSAPLPGRATPEATADQPARLGTTELGCSRLGFGSYRISSENPTHRQALIGALRAGVNLIDTSTNYSDGDSEAAIGSTLRHQIETGELAREKVILVSKLGYAQGSTYLEALEKKEKGEPFPEMVCLDPGLWHCLHPEFLEHQLCRSLTRLQVETLDVCLLHNPEYFLVQAAREGRELEEARKEFYRRLENAFDFLEQQVAAGRIAFYGVSSNTVMLPDEHPEATQLSRILKVVPEKNHFALLQLPLNLLEWKGCQQVLERAREAGLGVLANRPLNAHSPSQLVRLADFELEEEPEDWDEALGELERMEQIFAREFRPYLDGPDVDSLFRWTGFFRDAPQNITGLDHWLTLEEFRVRPHLAAMIGIMDMAAEAAGFEEGWKRFRADYHSAFRGVSNALEEMATEMSYKLAEAVSSSITPHLPDHRSQESLSRKALWVVASTPGVSAVLTGMRRPDYVEDAVGILDWEPLDTVEPVYEAAGAAL